MMLRLYKFQCRPNYPVCEGELIFAIREYKSLSDMTMEALLLAESLGFSYFNVNATLEYLGTFMPAVEHPEIPYIISCQTGEY